MIISFASSFQTGKSSHRSVLSRVSMVQNYQNLLEEALKMRQQSTNFIHQAPIKSTPPSSVEEEVEEELIQDYQPLSDMSTSTSTSISTSTSNTNVDTKQAWVSTNEPKTAREKASFKNKIPFNEEMYDVLKSSIEILSDRMSSKQPLTPDQAAWLSEAVEVILSDAKMYGPPARPIRSAEDDVE